MDISPEQRIKELEEENRLLQETIESCMRQKEDAETILLDEKIDRDILMNIAENLDHVIVLWTPFLKTLFVSPNFEKLYGIPVEKYKKNPFLFFKVVHPADRLLFFKQTTVRLKNQPMEDVQVRILVNGEVRWVWIKEKRIYNSHGKHILTIGTSTDITHFKKIQEELESFRNQLEQKVKERTEEYLKLNEEYETLNEELRSSNEELQASNEQLKQEIENRIILQRLLESSEAKYRNFLKQSTEGIMLVNSEGRIVECNAAMSAITGYSAAELIGMYVWDFDAMLAPQSINISEKEKKDFQKGFFQYLNEKYKEGPLIHEEVEVHTLHGEKYVRRVAFPVFTGEERYIGTVLWDITQKKKNEEELEKYRKHLEKVIEERTQALVRSEEQLARIIRQIEDVILLVDEKGVINYISPTVEQKSGYTQQEMIGKTILDILHPDDVEVASQQFFGFVVKPGEKSVLNSRIICKDGTIRHVEIHSNNLLDNPALKAVVVTVRDVTEREQARIQLQSQKDFIESINRTIPGFVLLINIKENKVTFINEDFYAKLGYTEEDIKKFQQNSPHQIFHPDDLSRVRSILSAYATASDKDIIENDYRLRDKIGRWRYFHEWSCVFSRDEEGNVKEVLVIMQDISKQKIAEQEVLTSRNMMRLVLDTIPVRVFWKDRHSRFLGCNKVLAQDGGFRSPDELIGKDDYECVWKEQAALYQKDDREVIEKGITKIGFEEPQTRPDGSKAWLRTSKVPLRDLEGNIIGVLGTYEDITPHKQAMEALRQSEERFRLTAEMTGQLIYDYDVNTGKIIWAGAIKKLTGYSSSEYEQMDIEAWTNHIHPDDRTMALRLLEEAMHEGKNYLTEYRFRRKDGQYIYVEDNGTFVRDHTGKPLRMLGSMKDIGERKMTEEILRRNEANYRALFEQAAEAIFVGDRNGLCLDANEKACQLTGYSKDELKGKDFTFLIPAEELQKQPLRYDMLHKGIPVVSERTFVRKDGRRIRVEMTSHRMQDERLIAFARDITDRYIAEEKLRRSEYRLRKAQEVSRTGSWELNLATLEVTGSDEAFRLLGYEDSLLSLSLNEVLKNISAEELSRLQKMYETAVKEGENLDEDIIYSHPVQKKQLILNIKAEIVRDENNNPVQLTGTIQDITEKRETESRYLKAMIETEERERQRLAQDLHDEIGPLLSSLNLYMSSLEDRVQLDEKTGEVYLKMKQIIKEAVQGVRNLSYALSPGIVINFGLHRAVQNIIDTNDHLIDFTFDSNIENLRFGYNHEIIYYRIIKELVNNTLKHAGAKHIHIRLLYEKDSLTLEYHDDGKGMSFQEAIQKGGLGLANILSRIKMLNGSYSVKTEEGKGFVLVMSSQASVVNHT